MKGRSSARRRSAGPLSKRAAAEGRTIVFVDDSGFYLLPMVVRTYAPVGKTPILKVKLTHDHVAVVGVITTHGQLVFQMQERSYTSVDIVRFLRVLLQKIRGKLLVIWDGSPIHRGQAVKAFLARGATRRIHLERLPGYAPELNPEEGIWNLLKRRELGNVGCADLEELTREVRRAKDRLRHRRDVILACFAHATCPL